MSELTIRRMRQADIPNVTGMGESFSRMSSLAGVAPFDHDGLSAWLQASLGSDSIGLFVAEQCDAIIGTAAVIVFPIFWSPSELIGQELFWWVDPSARGTAAAASLRITLERWAAEKGAVAMMMGSLAGESEKSVAKLYTRAGYKPSEHSFLKVLQ